MSEALFTVARMLSWIVTYIVKPHAESTPQMTCRVVTKSRYLKGFLTAMYLSIVINTRWAKVAKMWHPTDTKLTLSKAPQKVPFLNIRCTSTAIRIGCPTNPVKRSAPARQAKRIVDLFRNLSLVATAKITRAFNSTVGKTEMELMLIIVTRWL